VTANSIPDGRVGRRHWAAALWLALGLATTSNTSNTAAAQELTSTLYVRNDSDRTTVITPRLRMAADLAERTRGELVYTVDVWTSASIDIRTSASRAVTEQRDEINVALNHELDGVRLGAGYRYSTEPDYESHGGSLGAELDVADKSATVGARLLANHDRVGRVGDPLFSERTDVVSGRFDFTQILDPLSLVQGIYQLTRISGYQASPYRFVGIGSDDATCQGQDVICLPETNPELRVTHALALRGRRALGERLSAGGSYRFYLDDWSMRSHTLKLEGAAWLDDATLLSLHYRFYTQNGAEHYRPSYAEPAEAGGFYTRDKELSPLHSHRLGLELSRSFQPDPSGPALRATLALGPTHYVYRQYRLLSDVTAFEVTLVGALSL